MRVAAHIKPPSIFLLGTDELQKAQALLQEKESKVEQLEESLKDVKGKV